jgi:hypothetical protein
MPDAHVTHPPTSPWLGDNDKAKAHPQKHKETAETRIWPASHAMAILRHCAPHTHCDEHLHASVCGLKTTCIGREVRRVTRVKHRQHPRHKALQNPKTPKTPKPQPLQIPLPSRLLQGSSSTSDQSIRPDLCLQNDRQLMQLHCCYFCCVDSAISPGR